MMQPDVLPSVPYLLNKVRQGQRSLILSDGHQTVRGDDDCQHQGGREQGLGDMANTCESP